jgi:hypothetical protein
MPGEDEKIFTAESEKNETKSEEIQTDDSKLLLNKKGIARIRIKNKDKTEEIHPKIHPYPPMHKDAGAGIVKFFKITLVSDNKGKYAAVVKDGKFGSPLTSKTKICKDFVAACEYAKKQIEKKEIDGYKVK